MGNGSKYDVIIIGAGLGGLTTAALLSKQGYKVQLLEQHYRTGGYSTTFVRNGFTFDAAIHWINNIEFIRQVLIQLDALDRIEFKVFNPLTRVISPSYDITLSMDINDFQAQITSAFPQEKENIARFTQEAIGFVAELEKIVKCTFKKMSGLDFVRFGLMYSLNMVPLTKKYRRCNAEYVINSYFKDERLKTFFHSLGTIPSSSVYPILTRIGWAATGNYYYPAKGGGDALAELLTEICSNNGVDIKLNTFVSKLRVENGNAVGVETATGDCYYGKYIVSDADAILTYKQLIGENYLTPGFLEELESKKKYPSFCLVSLGTDYDLESHGLHGETITYNPTDDINDLMGTDISKNRKFIHLRSMRDNTLAPPGCHTVSVGFRLPFSYENYWKTGPNLTRGPEYQTFKQKVCDSVIDNITNIFNGIKEHIKVKDIATPITFQRYTLNSEGSMMGWEESSGGISRKEPVKKFYRVGHWSFPGGGTPRVLVSGLIVSDMIQSRLK